MNKEIYAQMSSNLKIISHYNKRKTGISFDTTNIYNSNSHMEYKSVQHEYVKLKYTNLPCNINLSPLLCR